MVSDIKCTLCGVSLNIARIRTIDELREHAWSPYCNYQPGSMFAEIWEHDSNDELCDPADRDFPGQRGCMVAFREDVAWRLRGLRGMSRKSDGPTWDEIVYEGLDGKRVDLELADGDEDWVPQTDGGDDEMSEEEMQYEYGSISESCEDGDTKMLDSDGDSDITDDSEYQRWIDEVIVRHIYPHGLYTDNSTDWEKIERYRKLHQLAEEFRLQVPDEVRLPCHVPSESLDESLRSTIEDKYQYARHSNGMEESVASYLFHPLNYITSEDLTKVWEHLAGPDCRVTAGYNGNKISIEEMLTCNVVQGILLKDTSVEWEVESTDEDWEGQENGRWHLTGLKDNIDGSGDPHPNRHPNRVEDVFHLNDVNWEPGNYAMVFHPPCLEVFRRVSLERNGRIDIDALGDWWSIADFHGIHDLPRDEDVRYGGGGEENWAHGIGTEYLGASPCFVPTLKNLLASSRKSDVADRASTTFRDFPTLPIEIQHLIMSYLEIGDIASLGAASASFRQAAENALERHLLHNMPHLWELWCDKPYSKWTGTTAAVIKEAQDKFEEQEAEISRILNILQEEGHHEEHAQYKQYWDNGYAERKAKSRAPLQEKPSDFVNIKDLDLVNFVLELEKARKDEQSKGLKNRERLWVDCNMILDRIEASQKEGKIPSSYD